MTIRDLKLLLSDYKKIELINYDTNEVKNINDYKQQGRKIKMVAPVMYISAETATVFYTNK